VSEIGDSRYKLMVLYYALGQSDSSFHGSSAGPGLNVNEPAGLSKRTHRAGPKFRRAGKFRSVQSDLEREACLSEQLDIMKQKLIDELEWSPLKFHGSNCPLDRSKFS